jgi:ATP-dependent DNA helicase RecQ
VLEFAADRNILTLESKGLTEVYQVNTSAFHHQILANQLHQYVDEKQGAEIERIATMIRFFKLNRCLNHNLARYFGDQHSPEHCGHCSVCRGKALSFEPSSTTTKDNNAWQDGLASYVQEFAQLLGAKSPTTPITAVLITRYLTGLTQPIFTKMKARQLRGFGVYEEQRYLSVLEAVTQRLSDH